MLVGFVKFYKILYLVRPLLPQVVLTDVERIVPLLQASLEDNDLSQHR